MVDTTPSMTAGRGEAGRAEVFVALLRWVRRYTPHYVALALIVGAASLIPVGQAEALRRVFNAVYEGSVPLLRQAAVYFGAVFFGGLIVQIARTWLSQRLYNRSTLELQREVLRRMFRLDLRLLNRWHVGDQIQRIGDSAVAAQDGVNRQIPALIERLLSVLLLIVYLTVQSWQLMAGALAVALFDADGLQSAGRADLPRAIAGERSPGRTGCAAAGPDAGRRDRPRVPAARTVQPPLARGRPPILPAPPARPSLDGGFRLLDFPRLLARHRVYIHRRRASIRGRRDRYRRHRGLRHFL